MNRVAGPKFMEGVIVLYNGKEVPIINSHLRGGKWVYQLEGISDMVPENQLRYASIRVAARFNSIEDICRAHGVTSYYDDGNGLIGVRNRDGRFSWYHWTHAGFVLSGTTDTPQGATRRRLEAGGGNDRIAKELVEIAREITAAGRATIILTKDDFRNHSMWNSILEQTGIAAGEEADFNEPETVELTVVDTRAY